jgi:hypothetical protein
MKRRPWPIVLLAMMQLFSPSLSVAVSAIKLHTAPQHLLWMLLKYGSAWQLFDLFGTGLIAAFAIFSMKRWSYPVFLAIFGWDVFSNISVWHQFPQVYSVTTVIFVNAANILLVSYFLIPAVRAAYFNPKLRWWESKPRFSVAIVGKLKSNPTDAPGSRFQDIQITDISEGGAYIIARQALELGQKVSLTFNLHELKFAPTGKIVHRGRDDRGYGVQFVSMELEEHRTLKRAI